MLLDPAQRRELALACSTNVDNLSAGRYGVLLASAVVLEATPRAGPLLALTGVLGLGELLWGPARLAGVATGGHVGASLLVAAGLRVALARGRADPSLRGAVDVGTSYVALAVTGALAASLPGRVLPAAAVAVTAGLLGSRLRPHLQPVDAGHALAGALGAAGGALLRRRTAPALSGRG